MKRVFLVLLMLGLGLGVSLWLGWSYAIGVARQRVEEVLTQALHQPSRVTELSVSLIPLRVRARGVILGAEPAVLARVADLEARVWIATSLLERRLVFSVRIDSPFFDVRYLPPPPPRGEPKKESKGLTLPAFRINGVDITQAQMQLPFQETTAVLSVGRISGRLAVASSDPRLTATVDISGADLEHLQRHLRLTAIHAEGGFDRLGIFVNTGTIDGEGIAVNLERTAVSRQYAASVRLDLGPFASFLHLPLSGEAKIDGTVTGNLANPDAEGQLVLSQVTLAQHLLGDLQARVSREAATARVAELDVAGPLGHATGAAELTISKEVPFHGDLRLEGVDVEAVLAVVEQHLEFTNQMDAAASVSGTFNPLQITARVNGGVRSTAPSTPQNVATLAVNMEVDAHGPDLQIELTQPPGNRVAGTIAVKNAELTGRLAVHAADVAALATLAPGVVKRLALTGVLDGSVTFSGPAKEPTITAGAAATGVTVMGAAVRHVTGEVTIQGPRLSFMHNLQIDTGTGGVELSGAVALDGAVQNDWQLVIRKLDTDVLAGVAQAVTSATIPISGGAVDGTVRGRGTWERAELQGQLAASAIYALGEPLDRVEIRARTQLPEWTLHVTITHMDTETLTVDGAGSGKARVQLTADSTPIQLTNFRGASRARIAGALQMHAQLSGKPLEPDGSLTVSLSNLVIRDQQLSDVALHATAKQGDWRAIGSAFGDALELDATLRKTGGYPYTLGVRLHDLQVAEPLSADPSLRVTVTGALELTGSATAWATPNGTLQITRFEARRDEYRVAAPEPIRLDVEDGRFRIRSLILEAQGSRLSASGEVTTSGQCDIQARGEGDLVLLELIGRPFHSARGQFTVMAHVRRAPESGWDLGGRAQLHDATVDLGLPIAFTDTNGNFSLSGSSVRVESLDGKAGGGQFHVDGTLSLDRGPNLSWKLQDVGISTTQGFEARVGATGRVEGTWKAIGVDGEVEVLNALYDKNIELADLLPFFREQIKPAPRTQPPSVQVRLGLHIRAPDGVYVDNNFAKAELSADLRIAGTADKPELTGTIELLSGEVTFRDRVFNVTAGSIDFRDRGRINPVLNVTADSAIHTAEADYTVTVSVTGTAENPRAEFSADDPNLSQNDIVSLITFGKTTAQLQREGGGVSAADVLALLPTGAATGRVGKFIGVDRFEVEAAQSRNSGSVEPRVTIGKDLTDRLRASVSSSFGVEAQRLVQLEYRFSPRISLLGTWEGQTESQAGAFGGDIKFRYEFRHLPFSLLPGGLEPTPRDNEK